MEFVLPPLPYDADALEPVISRRTVHHHYEKHHAGYLRKLDDALKGDARKQPLESIVIESYKTENQKVFNLAAQVWNHTFYWHSLSPEGGSLDDGELNGLIDKSFGSMDAFKESFAEAALNEFGSGWAWLLYDRSDDELAVASTTDAVNPLPHARVPLLTLDVWEHAYYLDYQQERAQYVEGFLDKLINWTFAAENLRGAR